MKNLIIYTDGACSGNPGNGGYGVVIISENGQKELSCGYKDTTNNRMELLAVITALETLTEPSMVQLFSDSKYVVDAINKGWLTKWRANNWMRNKKEPALNVDLWQRLIPLIEQHNVRFNWVKGHSANAYNNRCDELARQAIPKDN